MADSFHHTRNRKHLLLRLLLASWFMTIGNIVLQGVLPNDGVVLMNNAFMTFFVSGLYMLFYDMFIDGIKTRKAKKSAGAVLLCFVPVLTSVPLLLFGHFVNGMDLPLQTIRVVVTAFLMLPNILTIEGGVPMVMLGVLFYALRKRRLLQIAVLAAYSILMFALSGGASLQWIAIFAAVPMLLYNGEKGRGMKRFFYIFYPAHIYLLYIIASLAS
jgi:hypothetical protein